MFCFQSIAKLSRPANCGATFRTSNDENHLLTQCSIKIELNIYFVDIFSGENLIDTDLTHKNIE